ncbi:MAG: DUF1624 domain-containing protein [Erysipelotrichia bacterium]|nr:DUF1624 domain-containing protein [Erysipelotrichia bacterium]
MKRIEYIDVAKGIGIILVVIGHSIIAQMRSNSVIASFIYNYIYSFHMALFFVLSGYLFSYTIKKYTSKKIICEKFSQLMIPYFSVSILNYVLIFWGSTIIKRNIISIKELSDVGISLKDVVFQIITCQNHLDKHLWFLYTMFLICLLTILFKKNNKKKLIGLVYIAFVFMAICDFPFELGLRTVKYFVYFGMGFSFYDIFKNSCKKIIYFIFFVSATICSIMVYQITNNTNIPIMYRIIKYFIETVASVSGTISIIMISKKISNQYFRTMLAKIGKQSLSIYLIHQPFICLGCSTILYKLNIPIIICCFVSATVSILLSMIIGKLLEKNVILSKLFLGRT